ncbi:hypothetical protein SANA_29440 [Gottschalkiaceae bacterium SANA]|nr:hypothetical protein SANA_29440 [Gottschalkiaceae bacterium SANA]
MKNKQIFNEILQMGESIWNFGYIHRCKGNKFPETMIDWSKVTSMEGVLGAFLLKTGFQRLENQENLLIDQGWLLTALAGRQSEGLTEEELRQQLIGYQKRSLLHQIHAEMERLTKIGNDNPYEKILMAATADLEYLSRYEGPVTKEERKLAEFLFAYDPQKLRKMGERIAGGFMHGFISQSRDRRNRRRVRFYYQIGQEALAIETVKALKAKGLTPVVTAPQSMGDIGQWATDHAQDEAVFFDEEAQNLFINNYQRIMDQYAEPLDDTCGMIGIGQFGEEAGLAIPGEKAYRPSKQELEWMEARARLRRRAEGKYLKPSELSFCKVTFPNIWIGENFKAVFEDFYDLNIEESEPFERIQQRIIDVLDTCRKVRIKGQNGNLTDLTVSLKPLDQPNQQTNFLNCGGDLNIPYGELFTTPQLVGTTGVYHVKETYLRKVGYKNLILKFKDGRIVSYGCGNTGEEERDRAYVRQHLLGGNETLTMGEFAIGSNTRAFAVAKKHNLLEKLPILLVEKMGPHIAIGDPCFARGEDAEIYNLYDNKEMVARENEHTACRLDQGDGVYFNRHIDITLPYNEIKAVTGVTESGKEISIIQNGRFVLVGTEPLNLPLDWEK